VNAVLLLNIQLYKFIEVALVIFIANNL